MSPQDWSASFAHAVTMALSGATGDDTAPDDPFLLMLNSWWEPLDFKVPDALRSLTGSSRSTPPIREDPVVSWIRRPACH